MLKSQPLRLQVRSAVLSNPIPLRLSFGTRFAATNSRPNSRFRTTDQKTRKHYAIHIRFPAPSANANSLGVHHPPRSEKTTYVEKSAGEEDGGVKKVRITPIQRAEQRLRLHS